MDSSLANLSLVFIKKFDHFYDISSIKAPFNGGTWPEGVKQSTKAYIRLVGLPYSQLVGYQMRVQVFPPFVHVLAIHLD